MLLAADEHASAVMAAERSVLQREQETDRRESVLESAKLDLVGLRRNLVTDASRLQSAHQAMNAEKFRLHQCSMELAKQTAGLKQIFASGGIFRVADTERARLHSYQKAVGEEKRRDGQDDDDDDSGEGIEQGHSRRHHTQRPRPLRGSSPHSSSRDQPSAAEMLSVQSATDTLVQVSDTLAKYLAPSSSLLSGTLDAGTRPHEDVPHQTGQRQATSHSLAEDILARYQQTAQDLRLEDRSPLTSSTNTRRYNDSHSGNLLSSAGSRLVDLSALQSSLASESAHQSNSTNMARASEVRSSVEDAQQSVVSLRHVASKFGVYC